MLYLIYNKMLILLNLILTVNVQSHLNLNDSHPQSATVTETHISMERAVVWLIQYEAVIWTELSANMIRCVSLPTS